MLSWIAENRWLTLFLVRLAFSVCAFAAGAFVAWKHWGRVGRKCLIGYYVMRLGCMAVLAYAFDCFAPDISCWGEKCVEPILGGAVIGRDYHSAYYIGFLCLISGASWMFRSYYGMVVLYAIFELGAIILIFTILSRCWEEKLAKRVVILYLSCPFGVMISWLGCQDEPIALFFMLVYLYFALFGRFAIGWRFGTLFICIAATKILSVVYLFPIVLIKRLRGFFSLLLAFLLYWLISNYVGDNAVITHATSSCITLGNPWFIWSSVPKWLGLVVFVLLGGLLSMSIFPLFYRKDVCSCDKIKAVAVLVITSQLLMSLTQCTYFAPYLLPIIPFLWLLALLEKNVVLAVAVSLWTFVFAFIDSFLYGVDKFGFCNSNLILTILSTVAMGLSFAVLGFVLYVARSLFTNPIRSVSLLFK